MPKRNANNRKNTRAASSSKPATPTGKTAAKAKVPAVKTNPKKVLKKGTKVTKVSKKAPVKPAAKVAKKAPGKPATKPAAAGKAAAKSAPKASKETKTIKDSKPTKAASKPPASKPGKSKKPAQAPEVKPPETPPVQAAPPEPAAAATNGEGKKPAPRKNLSGSDHKPSRKGKAPSPQIPKFGEPLFRPGAPAPKPLIASGLKAAPAKTAAADASGRPVKSPLDKKQLEHFRQTLLHKRLELIGDVATMETEALMSQSGALSHLPQHMAEQGSDAYGQSLSLDLAAADRRLIKEIDDALLRIQAGTYGVCELTHKAIKLERLHELPWARYSIEAARELERRGSTQ